MTCIRTALTFAVTRRSAAQRHHLTCTYATKLAATISRSLRCDNSDDAASCRLKKLNTALQSTKRKSTRTPPISKQTASTYQRLTPGCGQQRAAKHKPLKKRGTGKQTKVLFPLQLFSNVISDYFCNSVVPAR